MKFLFKFLLKGAYYLTGVIVIYVILLLYLNSNYNTRLISSFLSKIFPGKVTIGSIKFNKYLSEINIKDASLIGLKGENIVKANVFVKISLFKFLKKLALDNRIEIDSMDIKSSLLNLIFDDEYELNIHRALSSKSDPNYKKLYKDIYNNGFLLYEYEDFFEEISIGTPFTMLLNNISINGKIFKVHFPDFEIKANNWKIKYGSFQILNKGVLIRGDLELNKNNLEFFSKKGNNIFFIDNLSLYSFELNRDYLKFDDSYISLDDTKLQLDARLDFDVLAGISLNLKSNLKTSIIDNILSKNNIKLPEKIKLGDRVFVDISAYGSLYYPLAKLNANIDKISSKKYLIQNANIEGYYEGELSELNVYAKKITYDKNKIDRFRTKIYYNNVDSLKTDNISFNLNKSSFKAKADFNLITGKLNNFNLNLNNFNPSSLKLKELNKLSKEYIDFLKAHTDITLKASADNVFEKKNINSSINIKYKFSKNNFLGKYLNLNTKINFNDGIIRISKNTYLENKKNRIKVNGKLNTNNNRVSLYTSVNIKEIEKFLRQFGVDKNIKGDLKFNASIYGSIFNPKGKIHLGIDNFDYLHYKNSKLSSDFKLNNGEVELYGFSLTNKDFNTFVTGKIKLFDKNIKNMLKDPEFSVYLAVNELKLSKLLQNENLDLNLNSRFILSGTFSKPEGSININSDKFIIKNEDFDSLNIDLSINSKKDSILAINDFKIFKDKKEFLILDGFLNIKNMDFELSSYFPRLTLDKFSNLIVDGEKLIYGDLISNGYVKGNLKDFIFDYNFDFRFASFMYPYNITTTKTLVKPSKEFGKPNEITFKEVKIAKKFNLGDGILKIRGNEKDLFVNGKLFGIFDIDSKVEELLKHPVSRTKFIVKDLPIHKFHNYPVETVISLSSNLDYDLKDFKILSGKVIFDKLNVEANEIKITNAKRKLDNERFCIINKNGKKEKHNCIEFFKDKLYLDTVFSFLGENISLSGKYDLLGKDLNIVLSGGIDLKSLSYFKNTFSSIDGKAFIFSTARGKLDDIDYNLNLRIKNAAFQLVDFDKNISIDNASLNLRDEKVYIRNFKGDILGGNFEISGNNSLDGLIFDIDKKIAYLKLKANNLQYALPEVAEVETSLDLDLSGPLENMKLFGDVKILDGHVYQSINILDKLFGNITNKTEVYEESFDISTTPILNNISLDLNIINNGINVSNDLVDDMFILSDLKVGGRLGAPIIDGIVSANEGRVKLLSHFFELTNFMLKFNKADLMFSKLDFESEAQIKDYNPVYEEYIDRNVYLNITGELGDPKVELTGDGLTKLQTMMLLLTGQSGVANTSSNNVDDNRASMITNQLFAILLQNALQRITSDVKKQVNLSLQTSIDSDGNFSVSANQMIGKRIKIKGTGEFKDNTFQKEILVEFIIIDKLVLEALKAFEEGNTDLLLKYRFHF